MAYSFAESLRAIRLQKGLTQEQVALACGWSGQSRIANYESAASARQPKPNEIPLLARALGVSVAELFGESPLTTEPKSHTGRPDPDILHEAITLLVHDEGIAGEYAPREQSRRLADLYEWVAADGGRLSAESNREYERQVETRQRGKQDGSKEDRGSAKASGRN